jgi:predicted DNA-binding protein (MmcQ/YjbR family)
MTSRYPPVALPDAPYAKELRQLCLSLEGAWEDYPWGDIVYKVGTNKMFAALGGNPIGVTVKATPDDAAALVELPFIERARYIGRYGWVTVTVADDPVFDLARDLIVASHALNTPKRRRVGNK